MSRSRMSPALRLIALFAALASSLAGGAHAAVATPPSAASEAIAVGAGSFTALVLGGETIPVFTYRAAGHEPDDPVVIVLAGGGRNGDDYRDAWSAAAERHDLLVLAPAFDEAQFPGPISYNLAGMVAADANAATLRDVRLTPSDSWLFADIEAIFDQAVARTGSRRTTYDLFGHSAGAQIVHRLVLFAPRTRVGVAVAANAGWYTTPDAEAAFPYGLNGLPADPDALRNAFGRLLVVLLGELDNETETRGELRVTPETTAQGSHRLARGRHFHQRAQAEADRLATPLAWRLSIVPGVGHDYRLMSEAAARYLYEREPTALNPHPSSTPR